MQKINKDFQESIKTILIVKLYSKLQLNLQAIQFKQYNYSE